FEDRLQVEFELEQGINDALVPKLILQPLIENSIKHAVNPTSGAVSISVKAARQNGSLLMQVKDDGPGLKADKLNAVGNGLGLANTAERLDHLYGNQHEFDLRTATEGGLLVSIKVPYHTTPATNGNHN
ncbi:MAG TPA: ATP-binding protein, partial [Blastocatellia bacterium]|nr:ATP-binding protein [Blastocatellia bacterium]